MVDTFVAGQRSAVLEGAVSWWLTPRIPDLEVGGSSPSRVAVLYP